MVYDGYNQDDTKFTKEFVGSLGDFSTANQWSMKNLVEVPVGRETSKENTHN
jgi:hypothetical protein